MREQFCGRKGEHGGKLDDRIGARKDRMTRARVFIKNGGFAALGEISAHHADHRVAAAQFPRFSDEIHMPVVQGIVFANNAANFHFFLKPFTFRKNCIIIG